MRNLPLHGGLAIALAWGAGARAVALRRAEVRRTLPHEPSDADLIGKAFGKPASLDFSTAPLSSDVRRTLVQDFFGSGVKPGGLFLAEPPPAERASDGAAGISKRERRKAPGNLLQTSGIFSSGEEHEGKPQVSEDRAPAEIKKWAMSVTDAQLSQATLMMKGAEGKAAKTFADALKEEAIRRKKDIGDKDIDENLTNALSEKDHSADDPETKLSKKTREKLSKLSKESEEIRENLQASQEKKAQKEKERTDREMREERDRHGVPDLPDPKKSPADCGRNPGKPSHICDAQHLLPTGLLDVEDSKLDLLKTGITRGWPAPPSCPQQGWQLDAAVIGQLDRKYVKHASLEDSARAYAADLGREWGVLGTSCRNGIMLLYAVQDGYALVLTDDGPAAEVVPNDLARHLVHLSMFSYFFPVSHEAVFQSLMDNVEKVLEGGYNYRELNSQRTLSFTLLLGVVFGILIPSLFFCAVYDVFAYYRHGSRVLQCKSAIRRAGALVQDRPQGELDRACPCCGGQGRGSLTSCALCAPPISQGRGMNVRLPLETAKHVLTSLCDQYPDIIDKREAERWAYMNIEDWEAEVGNPPYKSVWTARDPV